MNLINVIKINDKYNNIQKLERPLYLYIYENNSSLKKLKIEPSSNQN